MSGVQRVQSTVPSPRRVTKRGARESQLVEASGAPSIKRLDGEVVKERKLTFAGGTCREVWVGRWKRSSREGDREKECWEKVVLKALKSSESTRKAVERELSHWTQLHHRNILPFYGVVADVGPHLYVVLPWRENGTLLAYVKTRPQADKNCLLCGSAAGLAYLHSQGIVHGSVKCDKVLVSSEGEPQVCDFGTTNFVEEITGDMASGIGSGGGVRYSAPELIKDVNAPTTTSSDTWSFATLILECVTEKTPFSEYSGDAAVIQARISKRRFLSRPGGQDPKKRVSDGLWRLMMRCWVIQPDQRPTMKYVHNFFSDQASNHNG